MGFCECLQSVMSDHMSCVHPCTGQHMGCWLCLCVSLPAPLAARSQGITPALLHFQPQVLYQSQREVIAESVSPAVPAFGWQRQHLAHSRHPRWHSSTLPAFPGRLVCNWGARYETNKEQRSPFIKKFHPVQSCLQGGARRDVT